MTLRYPALLSVHVVFYLFCLCTSCGGKKSGTELASTVAADSADKSVTYTVALADVNGDGMRITYQFFGMEQADTGVFRMIHVYMKVNGTDDTMSVNGSWKLLRTDSGNYMRINSGRTVRMLHQKGRWNMILGNKDSLVADTGQIILRRKVDNDMRNSTIHLFGKVRIKPDKSALFIDETGDSIPIVKLSAFRQLLEKNDSVNLEKDIDGIHLQGTIQIRMAMDGKSTQKSLIVENVGAAE